MCCFFNPLTVSFAIKKPFNFMGSYLSNICPYFLGNWSPSEEVLAYACNLKYFPIFLYILIGSESNLLQVNAFDSFRVEFGEM